jgi:hypothetical protein
MTAHEAHARCLLSAIGAIPSTCSNECPEPWLAEAAHFLLAYLLAVPVINYDVSLGREHTDLAEAKLQVRTAFHSMWLEPDVRQNVQRSSIHVCQKSASSSSFVARCNMQMGVKCKQVCGNARSSIALSACRNDCFRASFPTLM